MSQKFKMARRALSLLLALCFAFSIQVSAGADASADDDLEGACTSFYFGSGTTENGSYIWGRSEDANNNAKRVDVRPAATYEPGTVYRGGDTGFQWVYPTQTLRYILCKDSQTVNGYDTDEVYAEVGMNEKGVSISATVTLSGAKAAINTADPAMRATGIGEEDIPSVVLMQATTAREACELLAEIIDAVGADAREGVMIGDPNEVWYFQTLSGHQYIAVKCPDDRIGYSPNITGNVGFYDEEHNGWFVDVTDEENVIASPGLIAIPLRANTFVGHPDEAELSAEEKTMIKVADSYASATANHWTGRMRTGYGYLYGLTTNAEIQEKSPVQNKYLDYFIEPRETGNYTLYEAMRLLAHRGEGAEWEVVNPTGNGGSPASPSTLESHVFETRRGLPAEIATVEWLAMGPAEYSVYLPFYGNLVTEIFEKYPGPDNARINYADLDQNSMDRVFRGIYNQVNHINPTHLSGGSAGNSTPKADRDRWGNGVLAFWERYQKELIKQQAVVDTYIADVLADGGFEAAEAMATRLSVALSEETYGYAQTILAELYAFRQAGTPGNFIPSVLADPDAIPHYIPPDYETVYAFVSGDTAEAILAVNNNSLGIEDVNMILTVYDADGRFKGNQAVTLAIVNEGLYTANFALDAALSPGDTYKVFAWDAETYVPLCPAAAGA